MRILILSNSHLASLFYAFTKMKSIDDCKENIDFCGIVGGGFNRCEFSNEKLYIKDGISNTEKKKISKEMLATYGHTDIHINSYDYIIIYSLGLSLNNYISSLAFRSDINGIKAYPLLSSKAVQEIYNRYIDWCPAARLFSVLGSQTKDKVLFMSGPLLNTRTVDLEPNKLIRKILNDDQVELFSDNYWSFLHKVSSLNNVRLIPPPNQQWKILSSQNLFTSKMHQHLIPLLNQKHLFIQT